MCLVVWGRGLEPIRHLRHLGPSLQGLEQPLARKPGGCGGTLLFLLVPFVLRQKFFKHCSCESTAAILQVGQSTHIEPLPTCYSGEEHKQCCSQAPWAWRVPAAPRGLAPLASQISLFGLFLLFDARSYSFRLSFLTGVNATYIHVFFILLTVSVEFSILLCHYRIGRP